MKPGPHCPIEHDYVAKGRAPTATCDWHREVGGRVEVVYPARTTGRQGRPVHAARRTK
jgi:hypothetical protein